MSTEFYCKEFPTEQNGKPVQTLKDLLEACPEEYLPIAEGVLDGILRVK